MRNGAHFLAGIGVAIGLGAAAPASGLELRAVMHLHSRYSHTGIYSLEELARRAQEKGIDVLIPTDTFLASFEYGVAPVRGIVRKRVVRPSVFSQGPDRYLKALEDLRKGYPGMIVLPGVEIAPFYRWEGSPRDKSLTVVDWHRHILAIGMGNPKDYLDLEVLGRPRAVTADIVGLWVLVGAFLLLGIWSGRRRWIWVGLSFAGALWLWDGLPWGRFREDPYGNQSPWSAYQRVIDQVKGAGGAVFWAHPEAPNWERPLPVATGVFAQTKPYPEAILHTVGHDGFAVFQEGNHGMAGAGGVWDLALGAYCEGRRDRPVWAAAELDYHGNEPAAAVDAAEMVVQVSSRTPHAVLEALRLGRFYSKIPGRDGSRLILSQWNLRSGDQMARAGGTLADAPRPVVELEIRHDDGTPRQARVQIIRDGGLLRDETVLLPKRWSFADDGSFTRRTYYRVMVRDVREGWLAANPIFCDPQSPIRPSRPAVDKGGD